ncbi:MAG: FkbM family methyltransferase [Bryobacterales bacterium]|nr:FkbM family methyltransferase [Bryobacterales bacterium]
MTSAFNQQIASALIPLVRTAMRTAPGLRRTIWRRVIQGRLDWRPFSFVKKAHFGAVFSGTTTDVLQRYIYYFGCWEPQVEAVIADCLRPGDTFIDVGANIGYFTLFGAKRVGNKGHVVAIEASSSTFERLRGNVERNAASGIVRLVHAAAADRELTVVLHPGPEDNSGMASMIRDNGGQENETVLAKTLGALLTEEEIESARLIKIDVEGAESLVIEGMRPILPKLLRCDLLVELSPALVSAQKTLDTLREFGWRPYEVRPGDSLDNYFETPVTAQLVPLSDRPTRRMDVLFRRD